MLRSLDNFEPSMIRCFGDTIKELFAEKDHNLYGHPLLKTTTIRNRMFLLLHSNTLEL